MLEASLVHIRSPSVANEWDLLSETLSQTKWYRENNTFTQMFGMMHLPAKDSKIIGTPPEAKTRPGKLANSPVIKGSVARPIPWPQTSSLQHCEAVHSHCLGDPVCYGSSRKPMWGAEVKNRKMKKQVIEWPGRRGNHSGLGEGVSP